MLAYPLLHKPTVSSSLANMLTLTASHFWTLSLSLSLSLLTLWMTNVPWSFLLHTSDLRFSSRFTRSQVFLKKNFTPRPPKVQSRQRNLPGNLALRYWRQNPRFGHQSKITQTDRHLYIYIYILCHTLILLRPSIHTEIWEWLYGKLKVTLTVCFYSLDQRFQSRVQRTASCQQTQWDRLI